LGLVVVLAAMALFFGILSPEFFSLATIRGIANEIPDLTFLVVGMTFVLIIAGIDLSVGSVLGLCGIVLAVSLVNWGWPLWLAVGACMAAGMACGLFNGFVSVRWSIPSFIVTLGMMEIARGTAEILCDSVAVSIPRTAGAGPLLKTLTQPLPGIGLSAAFFLAVALVVVGELVLRRTIFGRHALAIGGNERAAELSGIRTRRIKLAVFATSGSLAALGGIFQASDVMSANPQAGIGMELSAIAAVVIGGTSLMGGRGSVVNSFLGVLIITVLDWGLVQIDASEPHKRVITGFVVVLAVILDVYRSRLRGAT
jgi:ribose transport system permease protein